MQWLAGMRITEDRLNDNTADETTTAGLVPATDFDTPTFNGKKVNGVTTVNVTVLRNGATITATSAGNVTPDVLCCTLPVGWRPPETVTTSFDSSGTRDGSITILSNGTCTIKTMSPNSTMPDNSTVNFFAEWISENN
ncbi:minor tail protein [Streptomyces phage PHTowN]|nr:minor tail protein [Streptomyces phage PHTowN]